MRTMLGRWAAALVLAATLATGSGWADDVPAAARKDYDAARALYLKGDAKSLAGAFSALSLAKGKAGDSVDFWELFVRVWRANKKPEADLWDKLIAPREQAAPGKATFDLVRFRVEDDPAKKRGHLEKAIAREPEAVAPPLLLVKELRAAGEESEAEELLEKILAKNPALEEAQVAKIELMLEGGLSRSAMEYAEEQLAKKDCPGMRHALALAQRNLIEENAEFRGKAVANAEKAVAARPDAAFVATLADLLDEGGKMAEALALLKKHVATTPDPRLTKRLGDFAWRAGDYDEAARQLAAAATGDVQAAKAVLHAHVRRNRVKEALAAMDRLLALDKEAWPVVLQVCMELGDAAALRKHLAGRTFPRADLIKGVADGLEGKVADVKAALGPKASDGTREGEDYLLVLLEARLHAKLGAKMPGLLKLWRETRSQVVGERVASAKPDRTPLQLEGRSHDFMRRMSTYLRDVCGREMQAGEIGLGIDIGSSGDGEVQPFWTVSATSSGCKLQQRRVLRFPLDASSTTPHQPDVWDAAEAAFKDACAALVAEDYAKAQEALTKALEQEKGWFRASFLKALAAALQGGGDLPALARQADEAANALPDDWLTREIAIKLTVLAGGDAVPAMKALIAHQDARSHGPISDL